MTIKMIDLSFTKKMKVHYTPVVKPNLTVQWWNRDNDYFYYPYLMVTPSAIGFTKNRRDMNIPADTLVIADSGGFQVNKSVRNEISSIDVVEWQESIADIAMVLDYPPFVSPDNFYREPNYDYFHKCLDRTKESIKTTYSVYNKDKVKLYGIIHGWNYKMFKEWYKSMEHFDFDGWAISPPVKNINTDMLVSILKMVKDLGTDIHILGVTDASLILALSRLAYEMDIDNITCDSSSIYAGRRWGWYFIPNFRNLSFSKYRDNDKIQFLPCDCPICSAHTFEEMMNKGELIDAHNLYYRIRENIRCYGLATGTKELFLEQLGKLVTKENYDKIVKVFVEEKEVSNIEDYF